MMTSNDFLAYVFAGNDSYPMNVEFYTERNFVGYADRIMLLPLHYCCFARDLFLCSADTIVMQLLLL
jgi:hypothetical protein